MSQTSPICKSSHSSVSGFQYLLTSCKITSFSHSQLICFPLMGFGWISHSMLHISFPSQVMLFLHALLPPRICLVQTSCSSSTSFLLLYSLSYEVQQCPCCLQNTIPVNIFPSFCPLAGLFHLKGGSVVFFGFAVSFFGFFQREREKGRVSPVFLFLQTADSRARWSHLDFSQLFGLPRCMAF